MTDGDGTAGTRGENTSIGLQIKKSFEVAFCAQGCVNLKILYVTLFVTCYHVVKTIL